MKLLRPSKTKISLSNTVTGRRWLDQFAPRDRESAANMLNAMLLLSDTEVADAIRDGIESLAKEWSKKGRTLGLYAEREFDTGEAFESDDVADEAGRVRRRAMRYSGPVKPTRGKMRVGSEGNSAYLVSQMVKKWPSVLKNHPAPRNIRAKTSPVGAIVIVTDFIGSGRRATTMLDKFWKVPSVKSWVSRDLIGFIVVAAAGTINGIGAVQSHHLRPRTVVEYLSPTVGSWNDGEHAERWFDLISRYGPSLGRGGVPRRGYDNGAALIALSSGIPNNTPAILHHSEKQKWEALFDGAAPSDLKECFRIRDPDEQAQAAADYVGLDVSPDLTSDDKKLAALLSINSRMLRVGNLAVLSEMTTLPRSEVEQLMSRAIHLGLLTEDRRLNEAGQKLLDASRHGRRRRPSIATNPEPYYPLALRVPRELI